MKDKQIRLEKMFSKNQLYTVLKKEFSDPEILNKLDELNVPLSFGLKVLMNLYLYKQTDVPTLVGLTRAEYNLKEVETYLLKMVEGDLMDFDPLSEKFISLFDIDPQVKKEMEMYQFPLPMIVEPAKVKNNHTNGYLKVNNTSLLLNNSFHKEDICLDHINRVNRVPLSVDLDVAFNIKNVWKNLDKKSPKETIKEFHKRVKNYQNYMKTAYTVMELLVQEGNKIYLTHAYDKRGRTYSRGYHVLDQGNDWNKACIQFYNKEVIE